MNAWTSARVPGQMVDRADASEEDAMQTIHKIRHQQTDVDGLEVFFREAGRPGQPTVLLLHGFPSSSHTFREVMPPLAEVAHVIAPDLPGFGLSSSPTVDEYDYTFENLSRTIENLLRQLEVERFFLYLHDFGAAVGYHLATQYLAGLPEHPRALPAPEPWHLDQPPALVLWGRRDVFFDVDEVLASHRALERMDAHIYDGGHLLLETHAAECAELMRAFVLENADDGHGGRS
jgi:pimeloyl-ACP methyl ester carboxylesterase